MRNEIGFIAIGQAAGNIGLLLEEKGYNVLFINTSTEDLDLLKGAKHIYHIPGGEGCAKDRDKAKKHLAEHLDDLISVIRSKIPQKYVFCIFASGGGTGSGISPFLLSILVDTFGAAEDDNKFFSEPEKYFGAITILPSDKEVLQPVTNSYNCCRELLDIDDLGTIFFLDNNSMENKLTINKIFVDDLDTILRIPEEHKSTKGNVDKSEVKKVLFETHGAGIITCQKRENSTSGQLIRAIREKVIEKLLLDDTRTATWEYCFALDKIPDGADYVYNAKVVKWRFMTFLYDFDISIKDGDDNVKNHNKVNK